jgi:hypothetical protein
MQQLQGSGWVARYYTYGEVPGRIAFLVMERLGMNLSSVRRAQPNGCFSLSATLRLGVQMVTALEAVHEAGVFISIFA